MKLYYFVEKEQQFGPFTIEELKTKRLKKTTLVWADGMQEWKNAECVEELKDILIPEPPPIPKNEHLPIIETVKIKPPTTPKPLAYSSKYDLTYEKEIGAIVIGLLLLFSTISLIFYGVFEDLNIISRNPIWPFLKFLSINFFVLGGTVNAFILSLAALFRGTFDYRWLVFLFLALGIIIAIWVKNIASRQNRNTISWSIFALLFPVETLIIIGLLKKMRLSVVLDGNLSPKEQIEILLKKANKLFSQNRFSESIEILNKAIEINRRDFESIKLRGLSFFKMKNYEKAKIDFETLIENEQFLFISYYFMGMISVRLEKNREIAVSYFLKAKELNLPQVQTINGFTVENYPKGLDINISGWLSLLHTFIGKYILDSSFIEQKLGTIVDDDYPVIYLSQEVFVYQSGLPQIDRVEKITSLKTSVCLRVYGIEFVLNRHFKSYHLGISYYEIENIIIQGAKNIIEFHLIDKAILSFRYKKNDLIHYLKKTYLLFTQITGRTLDIASLWESNICDEHSAESEQETERKESATRTQSDAIRQSSGQHKKQETVILAK
jgi:tetratricopeptide (TPR) repeat protein